MDEELFFVRVPFWYTIVFLCRFFCLTLLPQKGKIMITVSSREFRANQKSYLDRVEDGSELLITRKNELFKLVKVSEDDTLRYSAAEWIREFMSIPEEYRCNPFDVSPSGDLFYADRRNVENMLKEFENAKNQPTHRILPNETIDAFLSRIESNVYV